MLEVFRVASKVAITGLLFFASELVLPPWVDRRAPEPSQGRVDLLPEADRVEREVQRV